MLLSLRGVLPFVAVNRNLAQTIAAGAAAIHARGVEAEAVRAVGRDNPALQTNRGLAFHATDNDTLIAYSKSTADGDNAVLAVVNLDPHHVQTGWVTLDLDVLGLDDDAPFQMHELLTGARYLWHGRRNFVRLDPSASPAHVFRVRRRVRTERDFDYFL